MILKSVKECIVLINENNCYNLVEKLFSNKIKFEVVNDDPSLRIFLKFKFTPIVCSLEEK